MNQIKYHVIDLILGKDAGYTVEEKSSTIPDGIITHFALVQSGNTDNEIIDLSILESNSEVLRGGDIRFSEKTANGNFLESLRPVTGLKGGGSLQFRLTGRTDERTNDVSVQILLVIQTNPFNL